MNHVVDEMRILCGCVSSGVCDSNPCDPGELCVPEPYVSSENVVGKSGNKYYTCYKCALGLQTEAAVACNSGMITIDVARSRCLMHVA